MNIHFESMNSTLRVIVDQAVTKPGCSEDFYTQVSAHVLQRKPQKVLLDFSQSGLLDSRFIGSIVQLYHLLSQTGCTIYLYCGENSDVFEIFRVMNIHQIIEIVDDPVSVC